MQISIITITYNSVETVRDTLDSITKQSYKDIDHIIVDGLSGDGTLGVVNEYPHVSKVLSEKDEGIYDAMNKGLSLASGEIIGILNSDDIYNNDYVIEKVAALFMGSDIDAVYGDLHYVDYQDTKKVVRIWKSGPFNRNKFLHGWMPPHPTFFVKKSVYEKFGGFNTKLKISADYELMLRLMYKHQIKVAYLPEVLVKMRMGGISNSSLKHRLLANNEDKLAWGINDLKPKFYIRWLKPLRKIFQFRMFKL
ncbi:MAG: glycosyltransferase involved in cell wall biosynthesis [Maribacter sp.]|jgi:glycosyltransferase involved in cell wall biosynthesis